MGAASKAGCVGAEKQAGRAQPNNNVSLRPSRNAAQPARAHLDRGAGEAQQRGQGLAVVLERGGGLEMEVECGSSHNLRVHWLPRLPGANPNEGASKEAAAPARTSTNAKGSTPTTEPTAHPVLDAPQLDVAAKGLPECLVVLQPGQGKGGGGGEGRKRRAQRAQQRCGSVVAAGAPGTSLLSGAVTHSG